MNGKEISGRGGCLGRELCAKHAVPKIRTLTGDWLCAVCEKDKSVILNNRLIVAEATIEALKTEAPLMAGLVVELDNCKAKGKHGGKRDGAGRKKQ